MPQRIQRKRTKGYRMPPGAVYVGRPTRWGNPFRVGVDGSVAECVAKYRALLGWGAKLLEASTDEQRRVQEWAKIAMIDLCGKNLACFCRLDQPCHADVLLEIANA